MARNKIIGWKFSTHSEASYLFLSSPATFLPKWMQQPSTSTENKNYADNLQKSEVQN
jgi:hypothetical protein